MLYATMQSYGLDWIDALPIVEMGLRSAKHSTTKSSPYEIVFGKLPNLPHFIPENIEFEEMSSSEYLKMVEKRRVEIKEMISQKNVKDEDNKQVNLFKEGDLVVIKTHSTGKIGVHQPKYEGPAIVTKILGVKTYMVKLKNKEFKRHEDSLKKWSGNYSKIVQRPPKQDEPLKRVSKRKRYPVCKYGFYLFKGE